MLRGIKVDKLFLNRTKEIEVLNRFTRNSLGRFAVVYGRRRCGKSTLIQKVLTKNDVYFQADLIETPLQIKALSHELASCIEGFDRVVYPSWNELFSQLATRCPESLTLVLDEFPYLEQMSPGLSSILQRHIDKGLKFNLIICGSSQRLMHGIVIDSRAPLYGRASEILKIKPLEAGFICEALGLKGKSAIESYAVWGGIPRFWELAAQYADAKSAIVNIILDRNAVLHDEPRRMLQDDMRTSAQPSSILSLIAGGSHRISEIAARLGKPSASLARPLDLLLDLGYIRREIPFGESIRSTKRMVYKLDDPFLLFWYKFVEPNRSVLERDLAEKIYTHIQPSLAGHVSQVWEQLARLSTAVIPIDGIHWKPAQRFWGNTIDGKPVEIDLIAESIDGNNLLIGEAKWQATVSVQAQLERLRALMPILPFVRERKVSYACFVPHAKTRTDSTVAVIDASDVLGALR